LTFTLDVAHNLLLAHAKAVHVYRSEFKETQHGEIGITLNCDWREPKHSSNPEEMKQNTEAAERSLLFFLGWFADPIYFGDYPEAMKKRLGDRLPEFTTAEKELLKGSSDFFGLNHYSSSYAEPSADFIHGKIPGRTGSIWEDEGVQHTSDEKWKKTDMGWSVVPWGFRKLLVWIQKRYKPVGGIIVTENGCAVREDDKKTAENDDFRCEFYKEYICEMHQAMIEGADVRGYFAWSFIDNFEWAFGYTKRFGMHWVNYDTMERVPKKSAKWFAGLLKSNAFET